MPPKKNYSINFFGGLNGDFSVSPQGYLSRWRKEKGATKAFIGPWDYEEKRKRVTFSYGDNHTHAISEE